MAIISLSTIPSRFERLNKTLQSLLEQSERAERIEVYIPRHYKRFPQWLPHQLPRVPDGVNIIQVDDDLGPATKILPAIKRYQDHSVDIVYCDDDRAYPKDWLRAMVKERDLRPDDAITNCGWTLKNSKTNKPRPIELPKTLDLPYKLTRLLHLGIRAVSGRKITKPQRSWRFIRPGYIDIMEGFSGVMVKPSMFDRTAFLIPSKLWSVDDIWLSGIMAKNNVGIWLNPHGQLPPVEESDVEDPLYKAVLEGLDREQANQACIDYMRSEFGIW